MNTAIDLGNIGSELSKAQVWEARADMGSRNQALIRALEILDKSIILNSYNENQLKELIRLREIIANSLLSERFFDISLSEIRDFCLSFALAVRRKA